MTATAYDDVIEITVSKFQDGLKVIDLDYGFFYFSKDSYDDKQAILQDYFLIEVSLCLTRCHSTVLVY